MDTNKNNDLIISYLTLRKIIGWLGMLLPFILLVGNFTINRLNILNNAFFINIDCSKPYQADGFFKFSISHYYYSTVGELFTGVLIAVALFMFSYKGHVLRKGEKGLSDKALTSLAGLFALGVVVFPASSNSCINDNMRTFLSSLNTGYIHFTMATLFFTSLSVLCMVNFRRTADRVSFGKGKQDNMYLFCGIGMLVCLVLIFIYSMWGQAKFAWLDKLNPVFCLEAIALILFGISWLLKGQIDFLFIPKKLKLIKSN